MPSLFNCLRLLDVQNCSHPRYTVVDSVNAVSAYIGLLVDSWYPTAITHFLGQFVVVHSLVASSLGALPMKLHYPTLFMSGDKQQVCESVTGTNCTLVLTHIKLLTIVDNHFTTPPFTLWIHLDTNANLQCLCWCPSTSLLWQFIRRHSLVFENF